MDFTKDGQLYRIMGVTPTVVLVKKVNAEGKTGKGASSKLAHADVLACLPEGTSLTVDREDKVRKNARKVETPVETPEVAPVVEDTRNWVEKSLDAIGEVIASLF